MEKNFNKMENDLDDQIKSLPNDFETPKKFKQSFESSAYLNKKIRDLINVALTNSNPSLSQFEKIFNDAIGEEIGRNEILGAAYFALIQSNGLATTVLRPVLDAMNKNIYEKLRSDNYNNNFS